MGYRSSNYPEQLDNDVNLGVVSSATVITPPLHNNHTDAIESIQAFVGVKPGGWDATDTVVSKIGAAGGAGESAWSALGLVNGWTAVGAPFAAAGYRKDGSGYVHLRGAVHGGSGSSAVVGTLPAGYRPAFISEHAVCVSSGHGTLNVNANGTIQQVQGGVDAVTALTLDGVVFLAEA